MTEVTKTVRGLLETFVSGAVKVADDMAKLQDKRQGTYTNGVQAAILAGDKETFEKEIQSFMDDIRQNRDSYARKLGCKVAKRQPKGQPKNRPVYVVPSSVSALKTYMTQAFEFAVPLVENDEPRPYTQIRGDVQAIKAEKAKAELQGDALVRTEIQDALDAIASRLEKTEGDNLIELQGVVNTALETARKFSGIDAQRKAKKEKKAAAEGDKPKAKVTRKKAGTSKKKTKKKTSKKRANRNNAELAAAA